MRPKSCVSLQYRTCPVCLHLSSRMEGSHLFFPKTAISGMAVQAHNSMTFLMSSKIGPKKFQRRSCLPVNDLSVN